jgi:elongation factor Ts
MAISAKDVKELRDRTDAPMMECKAALEAAGGDLEQAVRVLRERGVAKMAKRADRVTAEGTVRIELGPEGRGAAGVVLTCETDFSARNDAFQGLAALAARAALGLPADGASPEALLAARAPDGRPLRAHLEDSANAIRENMAVREVVKFAGQSGAYVHFDGKSGALVEVAVDGGSPDPSVLAPVLRDLCMHIVAIVPSPIAVDAAGIPAALVEQEREIFIKQAMDSGKPREIAEKMVAGRLKKFLAERALLDQPFVKDPDRTVAAVLAQAATSLGAKSVRVLRFARLAIGGG